MRLQFRFFFAKRVSFEETTDTSWGKLRIKKLVLLGFSWGFRAFFFSLRFYGTRGRNWRTKPRPDTSLDGLLFWVIASIWARLSGETGGQTQTTPPRPSWQTNWRRTDSVQDGERKRKRCREIERERERDRPGSLGQWYDGTSGGGACCVPSGEKWSSGPFGKVLFWFCFSSFFFWSSCFVSLFVLFNFVHCLFFFSIFISFFRCRPLLRLVPFVFVCWTFFASYFLLFLSLSLSVLRLLRLSKVNSLMPRPTPPPLPVPGSGENSLENSVKQQPKRSNFFEKKHRQRPEWNASMEDDRPPLKFRGWKKKKKRSLPLRRNNREKVTENRWPTNEEGCTNLALDDENQTKTR